MKKVLVTIELEVNDDAEVEEVCEQIVISTRSCVQDIIDINIEEI